MNLGWLSPVPAGWETKLASDLVEDIGPGDLSAALIDPKSEVDWYIEAQAEGVLSGVGIAAHLLGDSSNLQLHKSDSEAVAPGTKILSGRLHAQSLLSRERLALDYLMLLSGTATLTSKFVQAVAGTGCMIVDTRKTIPGLRSLQKYAVRCGGGKNHRMGLYDGVMVKDNHIRAAGSINQAVENARNLIGHMVKIEVECESLDQLDQAVKAKANVCMLDNMDIATMTEAVRRYKGQTILEASGGVTLDTVRTIAETGVDAISVGALTHSAPALSLHLEVE